MYIKISKKKQLLLDIIMVLLGTLIMGFGFSIFLEPANISTGGFSGLSMIINLLLKKVNVNFLSTSIIYFVLNIGLFLYAFKTLGRKFSLKALIGIASFSGWMEVFKVIPFNNPWGDELLLCALYGGALMGIGIGIVVRFGGSTGGSDMIASIVRSKTQRISIGTVVIIVDLSVVVLSIFAIGLDCLPYTVIALILSSYITDFVNEGYKQIRAYHIITKKPDVVAEKIMTKLTRGCTAIQATGMHTHDDKTILICLVSKYQTALFRRIVKDMDSEAFVFSCPVGEVIGTWFSQSVVNKDKTEEKKIEKENQPIEIQEVNENTETTQPTETQSKPKKVAVKKTVKKEDK